MAPARDPRTLLIVEDEWALRRMLSWAFEELGYLVISAGSCAEARATANAEKPDYALLDFFLPDGNGHALAGELATALPSMQVVLMSADRAAALQQIGELKAAKALLEKPVRPGSVGSLFASAAA